MIKCVILYIKWKMCLLLCDSRYKKISLSVYNLNITFIFESQRTKVQQPKNGMRGAHPQGPQMYGAFQTTVSMRPPRDQGEPLRVQQDWTSVPPPE